MIKTIPKKKKHRKAKWLSEEALQIAEKRREVKGKRERERVKEKSLSRVQLFVTPWTVALPFLSPRKGKIYPTECRVPKNSKEK